MHGNVCVMLNIFFSSHVGCMTDAESVYHLPCIIVVKLHILELKCHLTPVSGVGSSPALATCETSQVLLASVSGVFPGVLPFPPSCQGSIMQAVCSVLYYYAWTLVLHTC